MNMIIKLLSINNGIYKVQIKPAIGGKYYKEFTSEAFQQYILDMESYCEWKGYGFHYFMDESIKKMVKKHYEVK